jgi:GalNAc-alpha-(1->4)-GalNAc-alpha-(1->3)-diNAcBac-PP-undecaprenol alpha-1,4-N-acetyl-D-galactosaminyltransferase
VQTESVRGWALEFLAAERVHVIPNPVLAPPPAGKPPADLPAGPLVVAMGRLHSDKGFDHLLRAVAPSLERHPEWSLVVLGDGPDRAALEGLARELGIAGRARFPGRVAAPDAVLRQAALFVLSSRFEGFPNALVEAMACGVAVVSTDCRSGPAEIVRQGVDGVLVPPGDPEALGAAIERLISDPAERARLAARAPEVVARFGAEGVLEMWNERIRACVA